MLLYVQGEVHGSRESPHPPNPCHLRLYAEGLTKSGRQDLDYLPPVQVREPTFLLSNLPKSLS